MADLLADVLAWCAARPRAWPLPLPIFGPLELVRAEDGTVTVEGDAPEYLTVTAALLKDCDPAYVAFVDGALALNVSPAPLRYRPLGPDRYGHTVVFERITESAPDRPQFSEGGWIPRPDRDVVMHAGERVLSNDMREA